MNTRSLDAGGPAANAPRPEQARRNRLTLLLLALSFVLPFVVGHLAYTQGWYAGGATNKGDLLTPPAALADLQLQANGRAVDRAFLNHRWQLVYALPAQCQQACRNSLFQMRQARRAMGAEADRIGLLLVQTQAPDAATASLLGQQFSDMVVVQGGAPALDRALAAAAPQASQAGRVYIMDPLGYIMLSYAPVADEKQSVVKTQDLLDDLKKLLKASQIG